MMDYILVVLAVLRKKLKVINDKSISKNTKRKIAKLAMLYEQDKKKSTRRFWVRPILQRRKLMGHSDNLIVEARVRDTETFYNYLRMTPDVFDQLLSIVGPDLVKSNMVRESIPAKTRLELTLRYLADGASMASIAYDFRLGKSTVSGIIADTCDVIWSTLKPMVFMDISESNWKNIATEFERQWNFKNCVGAIDGKHIVIKAPARSGSSYYNYKKSHSINLLAIVDANKCFIMVDIGAQGRFSDSGIFKNSTMGAGFENGDFNLPSPEKIDNSDLVLPYVLVGDEAFALTKYMMRPFPRSQGLDLQKKIFNYRLCRARMVVECCFGILAARWRIYRKPIIASVKTTVKMVQATVCLHNFLMRKNGGKNNGSYCQLKPQEATLRKEAFKNMPRTGSNFYGQNAASVRKDFTTYFETVGSVSWQWEKALTNDY